MSAEPIPLHYQSGNHPIPPSIFLGASSWTHEFWKGQIYHRHYKSANEFNLASLEEYAALGLFRLVEIDSTFYAPPKTETLLKYADLVPENFKFTMKIWERLSIPIFPSMRRYGALAGEENPSFLDPELFIKEILTPVKTADPFFKKLAFFLLQFPKFKGRAAEPRAFLKRLEYFLQTLPSPCPLAIEIRNGELLSREYIEILNRFGVAHCFSRWESMPPILNQMKTIAAVGGSTANFYCARLITPASLSFEEAGRRFEPFYQIRQRDDASRHALIRMARRALDRKIPAYIVINNRFEGNTPQSIAEIEELLSRELATAPAGK